MHPLSMGYPQGFNSNQYVYHYTSMATAINGILKNKTLRFNRFTNVNDPKESDPGDWAFSHNKETNLLDLIERIYDYFKYNSKVVCFSCDDQGIDHEHLYSADPCARGYAKPRMWATYGQNNEGVCLVFDKDQLQRVFENQIGPSDTLFRGSVEYGRLIPIENRNASLFDLETFKTNFEKSLNQKIVNHHNLYFFYKHMDWAAENEYRFVLTGIEQKEMDFTFQDALVGIVVGKKACKYDLDKIVGFANEFNVPAIQPDWGMMNNSQKLLNDAAIAQLRKN